MPIEVACPCGKRFAARDDLAGRTVACPACKAPLKIPAPRPAPVPVAQTEPTGVGSILDEIGLQTDGQGIVCPKCRRHIPIGHSVCQNCKYNLQTASFQKAEISSGRPHGETYDWASLRQRGNFLGSVVDEELTFGEMFLCAFFSCIAFPYGLILFLRGHSKGILIMLGSFLIPAFVSLIYVMFRFIITVPPPKKSVQLSPTPPAIMRVVEVA